MTDAKTTEQKSLLNEEDDDDNPHQQETTPNPSSSSLNVDKLTINDDNKKSLNDPEQSSIEVVTSGDTSYTSASRFEVLNLSLRLLRGLYVQMKFQKPSKIQALTLPMIMSPPYKDLIAQAHNGSGKTTCFALAMLSRVDTAVPYPQAVCICPTQELANRMTDVLRRIGKYTSIMSLCAAPPNYRDQFRMLKLEPMVAPVVVGTPLTIKKGIMTRNLSVAKLKVLVFDDADQMLAEDGFLDDSVRIMNAIEKDHQDFQVLVSSATFNDAVRNFVSKILKKDHNQLLVKKEELSLEAVKQYKVNCPDEPSKIKVIRDYIFEIGENVGQTIIFVRRESASMLHKSLTDLGYEVGSIHGKIPTEQRDKIVNEFRDGLTKVLISTDILALGFDQQQVNLVVNYDLPVKHPREEEPDYEVYLHRVGRAGMGAAFNLICGEKDENLMSKIEQHFGTQVTEVPSDSIEDYKGALKEAGLLQ